MKKYIYSILFVILFAGYGIYQYVSTKQAPATVDVLPTPSATTTSTSAPSSTATDQSSSGATSVASGSTPTPTGTSTATSTTTPTTSTGQYTDGTYAGSVSSTVYGNVQVTAVISGGKITDVQFNQYPSENPHSSEISNFSLPTLRTEAISAQSAAVNTVSGATITSRGFESSLSAALAQAK